VASMIRQALTGGTLGAEKEKVAANLARLISELDEKEMNLDEAKADISARDEKIREAESELKLQLETANQLNAGLAAEQEARATERDTVRRCRLNR